MITRMNCERVETLLGERLDGTLDTDLRAQMNAHLAVCAECRQLVSDVERIVADARVLPALQPSTDLWASISAKLGEQDATVAVDTERAAPAIEHGTVTSIEAWQQSRERRYTPSWRVLAAAAVLLVAVTSTVTWQLARVSGEAADRPVAEGGVPPANPLSPPAVVDVASGAPAGSAGNDQSSMQSRAPSNSGQSVDGRVRMVAAGANADEASWAELEARYVARSPEELDATYEREITALRRIVDERVGDLDSTTVNTLRNNLRIIDKAIEDSRAALRRDPKSGLLSRQLDRALEQKLELLRQVALL